MKNRQLLITIFIFIAIALITILFYDFFFNMDSDNLVNVTANNNNNNIVLNNHISTRDIKNVTSSITSNNTNTTAIPNNSDPTSPNSWVLGVALLGGSVLIVCLIGLSYYVGAMDVSPAPESIEMNMSN